MAREITAAQRKAVSKYEAANYDKVLLRLPKGERDAIKAAADKAGQSVNAYILQAVQNRLYSEREPD